MSMVKGNPMGWAAWAQRALTLGEPWEAEGPSCGDGDQNCLEVLPTHPRTVSRNVCTLLSDEMTSFSREFVPFPKGSGFQLGAILSPKRHLEMSGDISVVTVVGRVLLACSSYRPGLPLNLQWAQHSRTTVTRPQMSSCRG